MPIDYFSDMERVHKSKATAHNKLTLNKQYVQESTLHQKEPCADWGEKHGSTCVIWWGMGCNFFHARCKHPRTHQSQSQYLQTSCTNCLAICIKSKWSACYCNQHCLWMPCTAAKSAPTPSLPNDMPASMQSAVVPIHIISGSSQRTRQNKTIKIKQGDCTEKLYKTLWMTTSF